MIKFHLHLSPRGVDSMMVCFHTADCKAERAGDYLSSTRFLKRYTTNECGISRNLGCLDHIIEISLDRDHDSEKASSVRNYELPSGTALR